MEAEAVKKSPIMSFYSKLKKLNTFCATLAGLVLLFMTFSIFIDVILRYFFSRPTTWITEVSTYLFLYVIYLGTAYALQQGSHLKITFLMDLFKFKGKVTRIINLITSIFAAFFTFVLLWQGSVMTWTAYKKNWTSPTILNAPYAYIHGIIVLGALLLFISFVCSTILEFTGEETENPESA
jgi:TRAP-type C4-dicarboxylate transport system permease small subunit